MKHKLLPLFLLFTALMMLVTMVLCLNDQPPDISQSSGQYAVDMNEIRHLQKEGREEEAPQKTDELLQSFRQTDRPSQNCWPLVLLCGSSILFFGAACIFLYCTLLQPFHRLQHFAQEVAKGNLDLPLQYERINYFGDFTRSFDLMRLEITDARQREKDAIENNKTVIATLAHDIKTPIASLRAYSEALMAGIADTPEKQNRYCTVLIRKCDEVTKLTNDLFLHSVADLDKLKIHPVSIEICSFLDNVLSELDAGKEDIRFTKPDFTFTIHADNHRLIQIFENIVVNARKYAGTAIDVFIIKQEKQVQITFRDYGKGIPDEDIPFIFNKFYRGHNSEEEEGAGLGLFIVSTLTEKMHGTVLPHNRSDGLDIIFTFPGE